MTQHMAKLSKAIDAVRAAAEKINKRALPNTRWLSVAVDAGGRSSRESAFPPKLADLTSWRRA